MFLMGRCLRYHTHKESLCMCVYILLYIIHRPMIELTHYTIAGPRRRHHHRSNLIVAPVESELVDDSLPRLLSDYSIFLSSRMTHPAGANAGSYFSSIDLYIQRTILTTNTLRCFSTTGRFIFSFLPFTKSVNNLFQSINNIMFI